MAVTEFEDGRGRVAPPPKIPVRKTPVSRSSPVTRSSAGSRGSSQVSYGSRSSGSGGNSSSGSRGSVSVGRGISPTVSVPTAPVAPSIASYLASDEAYQQSVRGGKRSLTDFLSELNRRRGEAGTTFTQTKQSMETDRVNQLEKLRDEFASRGLIQSGIYGEEQGRFQQQFDAQMKALGQQQTGLLADLLSQERNFRREQELAMEVARQEALARRAQRFKIGA